jgi:alkylation response protein AidB-like acyl-CoA dehydrogenase
VIFDNDKVCLAGSGAPSGTAAIEGSGFRINGTWKYASGALHATMFTANCTITKDGKFLTNEDGSPVVKAFIVDRRHVILEKNWHSMGMIATGSHCFTIRDLYVSGNHVFQISPEHATDPGVVYQYPFLPLAEATLGVNYSGMTQQFLDLCDPVFRKRMEHSPNIADDLARTYSEAKNKLQECRDRFYHHVVLSWKACENKDKNAETRYLDVTKSSHELYRVCLSIMSTLYPFTGLAGANQNNEINRVWRNFHTASQHTLFSLG